MDKLSELELSLPDEEGLWKVIGFDDVEYRNGSEVDWDLFIANKVKEETGLDYTVRESRFNFGILLQSKSTQRKTRLHCAVTLAEQNNQFYVYLEDEDDFLPEKSCLDLKKMRNEEIAMEILTNALKDRELYHQLEENLQSYKTNEDFDGVRTFRRLKKFIDDGCPFVQIVNK